MQLPRNIVRGGTSSSDPINWRSGMLGTALSIHRSLTFAFLTVGMMASGNALGRDRGGETSLPPPGGNLPSPELRFESRINSDWLFKRQADPGAATEAEFVAAEKPAYEDSGWTKIALPHTWDATWDCPFPTSRHFRGVGWHRRQFVVRPDWQGRRVAVHFKGVFQIADVWVNGKSVGRHVGGFTGFQFDVTDLLQWNGPNLLAVRVEDVLNPEIAPANETNVVVYGGIYRSVFLQVTDPLHVAPNGTWVTTEGNAGAPIVRIRTMDREQRQDRCKRYAEYAGRGQRRSDRCHTRCQRDCRTRGDEGVRSKNGCPTWRALVVA
jgi:hypothetical protein